ncbi:type I restriction endonuclease [Gemmobacter lanyuensis]
MAFASEDDLEQWALGELQDLGFQYLHGSALSPEADDPVRDSFHDVLILGRLDAAIRRLNPHLPDDAVRTALNEIRDTKFAGTSCRKIAGSTAWSRAVSLFPGLKRAKNGPPWLAWWTGKTRKMTGWW